MKTVHNRCKKTAVDQSGHAEYHLRVTIVAA